MTAARTALAETLARIEAVHLYGEGAPLVEHHVRIKRELWLTSMDAILDAARAVLGRGLDGEPAETFVHDSRVEPA